MQNQVFSMMKTVQIFLKLILSRVCFWIQIMELLCLRLVYVFMTFSIMEYGMLLLLCKSSWLLLLIYQVDTSLRLPLKILDKSCQVYQVHLQATVYIYTFEWKKRRITCPCAFISQLTFLSILLLTIFLKLHFQGGNVGHLHKLLSIESSSQVSIFKILWPI